MVTIVQYKRCSDVHKSKFMQHMWQALLKPSSTKDLFFLLLLQIMAPGVDIIGLNLGGQYFKATGTSFAAAHVAGAAALILQK